MARTPFLGPRVLRNFLFLYGSTLFSGLGWGMVLPTIPVLAASFDVSLGAAAQTVTAWATGRFVGTPVSGIVLDRTEPRVMMVVGVVEPSWNLGREVAGIDLASQDQRGRVMSGFHGVHSAGMTLGPLVGGFLTVSAGFRYVFVAYALVAALATLCGLAVDRPSGPGMPRPSARTAVRRFGLGYWTGRVVALYREVAPPLRRTYAVLVVATCASLMCRLTLQSMLPLYAGGHLGFSPVEVGALFSISGVVVFFMIVPAGFVLDKVGRKWATVPSNLIPAVVFLLIPFAETFAELAVLVSLMGIANGLSLGCLATTTYDLAPQHARGRLQAMRRTIADLIGLGAPAGGGILANAFNPGIPFLALTPVLWLSALLLAFVARETLER